METSRSLAVPNSFEETLVELGTELSGLSVVEAKERLRNEGANALPEAPVDGPLLIFVRQFASPLIYLLVGAGFVLFLLGERGDAVIIFAILFFNAIVGAFQEGRAENTLRALRAFAETSATVLRDGEEVSIPDTEVVRGDIVVLREGEKVPADARLASARSLTVDEAALTGESVPVHKVSAAEAEGAESRDMVFKGTTITSGNGIAAVVATGAHTAIGKVAVEIEGIHTDIPLATDIKNLSRLIMYLVAGISVVLFGVGLLAGETVAQMFAVVVSLAVSVIPEGLPIVVTLVLAAGVSRMSKRFALVKKLQAVEALGQARVIAVDKTGTLTKNEMTVEKAYADGEIFTVEGVGYAPEGSVLHQGHTANVEHYPALPFLAKVVALGSDARILFSKAHDTWRVAGDPTEAALIVFAKKLGFHQEELDREAPRLAELPFDYRIKYHATLRTLENGTLLSVIGAPEVVLAHTTTLWKPGGTAPLTKQGREELEEVLVRLSREGLRVVAVSVSTHAHTLNPEHVPELAFVGFLAMKDALRAEVPLAMERAEAAGIRVVMITGDHAITAEAVAKEAGIMHHGDRVLTGVDIDQMTDSELAKALDGVSVFARVTPEHKLRIVEAFRACGLITAMTGDGVNDAPSLVAADLGVAMGKIGTEVAKEAADIVLLNDDFGSIVSAVEEGRSIYRTIQKVIVYLFSTGAAEVLAIAGSIALGLPLILLPAQIIWLNFVTDGFLTLALAAEPKEHGLLTRTFTRGHAALLEKSMGWRIALMALPMAASTLSVFYASLDGDLVKSWTIALSALAAAQWFNAWNVRSAERSVFTDNPLRNPWLLGATLLVILFQVIAVHAPFMQSLLHTEALTFFEWGIVLGSGALVLFAEEARKLVVRLRKA